MKKNKIKGGDTAKKYHFNKLKQKKSTLIVFIVLSVIFPFYSVYAAEAISANGFAGINSLFTTNFTAFLFSCIIVSIIYAVIFLISKRPYIAASFTGLLTLALGISNYFKMLILDKAVLPSDVLFLGKSNDITVFIGNLIPTPIMITLVIITIVYCVILGLLNYRIKLSIVKSIIFRIICPVLLAILGVFLVMSDFSRENIFPIFGLDIEKAYDSEYNYSSHGITGSFIINLGGMKIKSIPYSEKIVDEAAADYVPDEKTGEIPESPNVIVILSEAFWDMNQLENVEFSVDPIGNFKSLASEGWNIDMVSMTYASGTVRPEFEILTGLTVEGLPDGCVPYQQFVHRDTNSLASYFKDYGYTTIGLHTYLKNFYNRSGAYPLLGFDAFYGKEDIPADIEVKETGGKISDETFVDWIIYELENASDDSPVFIQALSMENHGPYDDKFTTHDIYLTGDGVSQDDLSDLQNMAQGIYDADRALKKLTDYLETCGEPTVVLYYGDHVAYGGDGYVNYLAGGLLDTDDSTLWDDETLLKMYTTPAMIWSNYIDDPQEIGYCSPYHLGALLIDYIGAPENELYAFLNSYREVMPVHNSMFSISADGTFKKPDELNEIEQQYVDRHWLFTYDVLLKNNYLLGGNN